MSGIQVSVKLLSFNLQSQVTADVSKFHAILLGAAFTNHHGCGSVFFEQSVVTLTVCKECEYGREARVSSGGCRSHLEQETLSKSLAEQSLPQGAYLNDGVNKKV